MSERNYKGPKYPTEAHGSIPAFNSYEEEAEFWDTHDFTDFKQETEAAKVKATTGLSVNETGYDIVELMHRQVI